MSIDTEPTANTALQMEQFEAAVDRLLRCAYRVQESTLANVRARKENLDAARRQLLSLFTALHADAAKEAENSKLRAELQQYERALDNIAQSVGASTPYRSADELRAVARAALSDADALPPQPSTHGGAGGETVEPKKAPMCSTSGCERVAWWRDSTGYGWWCTPCRNDLAITDSDLTFESLTVPQHGGAAQ